MGKRVTVIVPVYNVEKYLKRCLDSICGQSYSNLEIILVDDGSNDGSEKICELYAGLDKRITLIHQNNTGLSGARNRGLDECHGDYVTFVDSDDFIHIQMIEKMVCDMEKYHAQMCVCDCQAGEADKFDEAVFKEGCVSSIYSGADIYYNLFNENKSRFVIACAKLYQSEVFRELRFPLGVLNEDEYLAHKILGRCNCVVYNPSPWYYHFERAGSIMKSEFSMKKLKVMEALEDRMRFFEQTGNEKLVLLAQIDYLKRIQFYFYSVKKYFPSEIEDANRIWNCYQQVYKCCRTHMGLCDRIRYGMFLRIPNINGMLKQLLGARKI